MRVCVQTHTQSIYILPMCVCIYILHIYIHIYVYILMSSHELSFAPDVYWVLVGFTVINHVMNHEIEACYFQNTICNFQEIIQKNNSSFISFIIYIYLYIYSCSSVYVEDWLQDPYRYQNLWIPKSLSLPCRTCIYKVSHTYMQALYPINALFLIPILLGKIHI